MIFSELKLKGAFIIDPLLISDERGWFTRTFCKNEFAEIGFEKEWVQINHSFTKTKGTIRGMHYQSPPYREIKLVRCISGIVFDVIIDLRKNSPTFLNWIGIDLSAENKRMIYIPEGFAHGFQALKEDSELIYHHSQFYNPSSENGILYEDPVLNILWPLTVSQISDRDRKHLRLTENFTGI
jgi:dTDP-4-dehydrorhamnose 3,5-epimerase